MPRLLPLVVAAGWLAACSLSGGHQATEVFSGPQQGEPLAKFTVAGALGPQEGKDFDPVASAGDKPLLLIFVHEVNRPSVGMARLLGEYAAKRSSDGLHCAVVFLTDDPAETEAWIKRASGALPKEVPLGIFRDGVEGPGEYGLNRKVTMTILVANKGKVTANFALVQPSIQADAPKVLKAIVDVVGGKVPTLEELGAPGTRQRPTRERPKTKTEDGK
ncbi:MAG TPA: hypothetical protein VMP01_27860 [Pirellulaceae bacterium]|nr:hypothetical protein [Pirellulaceae bacterium]